MNFKYIALLLISSVGLLASCDSDSENALSTPSNDAQILSFSVSGVHDKTIKDSLERATDSLRFVILGKTKFAIDQIKGEIFNPDSLPYGTILNKLAVKISYKGNPYKVEVVRPDTLGYEWNSSDSVNFSKSGVKFNVSAGIITKRYDIKFLVHQVDPELLIWKQIGSLTKSERQKTVSFNNQFYSFTETSTGITTLEIISTNNGTISSEVKTVSGLPIDALSESITVSNGAFYVVSESGASYKSNDGISWTQQSNGKTIINILGILPGSKATNDQLFVIIKDAGELYLGSSKDLSSVNTLAKSPDNFPVKRVAATTNFSRNNKNNMLLISAGLDKENKAQSTTWWMSLDENGAFQINPSKASSLFSGGGLSSFFYDNKLYVLAKNKIYISDDWGLQWKEAPVKQSLSSDYKERFSQSVIVKDNNIWIFGGVSPTGSFFNDIWSGKLNSLK